MSGLLSPRKKERVSVTISRSGPQRPNAEEKSIRHREGGKEMGPLVFCLTLRKRKGEKGLLSSEERGRKGHPRAEVSAHRKKKKASCASASSCRPPQMSFPV